MSIDPLRVRLPIDLDYMWSAGPGSSAYLQGLTEGRLVGGRCSLCGDVYFPPRAGTCPRDGVLLNEDVEIAPTGTITTFCVVNVPFLGQQIDIPYVAAHILLDGADLAVQHLIQECPAEDVHMGMRVEAVWAEPSEWGPSLASITHFRPNGEPDAVVDSPARTV